MEGRRGRSRCLGRNREAWDGVRDEPTGAVGSVHGRPSQP
jgi:hypothetical protein